MRIVVTVKHVPNPQSERRIENGHLVRGEEDTLNDLDENAIEAALSAKEAVPEAEIIALTMGPEGAKKALLRALQMGADRAYHLCDPALAGSDVTVTARVLARAIQKIRDVDLVICGTSSLDGMTSMLPGALAASLQLPVITDASKVSFSSEAVEATSYQVSTALTLRAEYPLVLSVNDEANRPHYPGFKEMLAAKKKPIEQWGLTQLGLSAEEVGAADSGTEVLDAQLYQQEKNQGTIVTDSANAGEALAKYLVESGFAQEK
ncbi:MAG: electron transfer flavoprotein subunit beta/FixA family protein [Varibaculum cambriense]|uniref:electron transfer flavoprotein subunit beta/FixA family protein n=1 Tax=Varibaculum cambriense TaxID=184870 RepID=UPI00241E3CEF|nr:electron transfer flavoprotein subunit beta/FixA family protein [Varibaculum cambriense]MBS6620501.1 electron transfer flavoprotein subunit beta/FixA family protein [Varibaculum cambriense]